MRRGLHCALWLTLLLGFVISQPVSGDPHRLPRSLKRIPSRSLSSPGTLQGEGREKPTSFYHIVSKDVLDMRSIMGGGRKIIRHGCDSYDALEVVFTKDVGVPTPSLHSALSTDEGETWNLVGPLGKDPALAASDT